MKISFDWLKTFLEFDEGAEEISEILTDLGLEVEGLEPFESVPGSLQGVVVGEVVECGPHPNADKLKVTRVDLGNGEPVQIVCGAPNVATGQKVPVATIGTVLYTAEGESWKIKKGKIRGEASEGMICAEDELGLGESHDGIMVLDENLRPGTPCNEVFEVFRDTTIEIGLTPNRSDAMSHYGVARDLRAGLIQKGHSPVLKHPNCPLLETDNEQGEFRVVVDAPDMAPRYAGVRITGLEVGPSPAWLQNRLKSIGLKPINNIVDATNFILHDVAQPLHAFDLDKISGNTIRVGQVPEGTPFVTLDGVERILHSEDLLICDAEKPLCIAGVYGGMGSGVTETTTGIFLESAYFDPVSIRKTAKRHGLSTDASFRFERGIEFDKVHDYLGYAAQLIAEIAGGTIEGKAWDLHQGPMEHEEIHLSLTELNKVAGKSIPEDTVYEILDSLDIRLLSENSGLLTLRSPQYRQDVTRKIDVIEEILRVYGYNNIESSSEFSFSLPPYEANRKEQLKEKISSLLCYQGYSEIMTNSLVPVSQDAQENTAVRLLNPLSSELAEMRTELLSSGLQVLAHNLNRKQQQLLFFEFGHTYFRKEQGFKEKFKLGIWCARVGKPAHWIGAPQTSRFFELKGVLQSILLKLDLDEKLEEKSETSSIGEALVYREREEKGRELARILSVNPEVLETFDIDTPVAYAEVDWDLVLKCLPKSGVKFSDIPKFPEVYRDFSLALDKEVSFSPIREAIMAVDRKLVQSVELFDVFEGKGLEPGKKAYGLRVRLLDRNKTLTDKNIDKAVDKMVDQLKKEFGAELR